jgi:hypothetical protein
MTLPAYIMAFAPATPAKEGRNWLCINRLCTAGISVAPLFVNEFCRHVAEFGAPIMAGRSRV